MAKDKDKKNENTCGIREADGKYYCADCDHEIQTDQDCPQCKRKVNWDMFYLQTRR